jgi:outer membrane receptor for ferrienterochelin and colicins
MGESKAGRRLKLTIAVAGLAACAAPLRAADGPAAEDLTALPLEQLMEVPLVVAAAKRPQQQREAAASVTVIPADEIDLLGHRNLADVLRNQRGFYLWSDGLSQSVGVRGFMRPGEWNARILVLVDGRPTRDVLYNITHLDQDFVGVPVEAMKSVEIVRGPGSSLYGSNAVFSVISVNTLNGSDLNGGYVRVTGGIEETARVVGMYGLKTEDGWDLIGGAAGYSSQGDRSIVYDDAFTIRDHDYEGVAAAFFKVKKGDFSAAVDYATRSRDNRAATYLADPASPGNMHEDRANVMLRFDHDVAPGQSFHAMAYYGRYDYAQPIGYAAGDGFAASIYNSESFNEWAGQEAHYDWQVTERLHFLVGGDATQSIHLRQHDFYEVGGEVVDIEDSYNQFGVFAEAEYKAFEWLTLVAGARFDRVQDVGNHFSPRFAAILSPTKDDTVKLLYGRSFRAPNLYERSYQNDYYTANPGLDSEIIDTFEAVWERRWASGWNTSVGGFYWTMDDAMRDVLGADDRLQVQNTGTLSARGLEVELSRRWNSGGLARFYATYQRAEDDDGARLPLSPEWIAGGSVVIPLFSSKVNFLSIDSQVVGPMESDTGEETDPTFITHATFTSRHLFGVRNLQFQLSVHNLFADEARWPHGDAGLHAQPTLNWPETRVTANLSYRFKRARRRNRSRRRRRTMLLPPLAGREPAWNGLKSPKDLSFGGPVPASDALTIPPDGQIRCRAAPAALYFHSWRRRNPSRRACGSGCRGSST